MGGIENFDSNEELRKRIRELRHKGLRQGDHFKIHQGKLYIYDIPCSKMEKASKLAMEGMSKEDIAKEINENIEDVKQWFER